jgi:ornithine--oxo-acid transaminase
LQVLKDENLAENARKMGEKFRAGMQTIVEESEIVQLVRGKGLLNAVVIKPYGDGKTAWDVCVELKENGLLAKPTHGDIIRFAPPLVITEEELDWAIAVIRKVMLNLK